MKHAGVIGAGGWGTALSMLLARNGYRVDLWAREEEVAREISTSRTNEAFLPGVTIHEGVLPTTDLGEVVSRNVLLFMPVPSQHMRGVVRAARPHLAREHVIIHAGKGIEEGSLLRLSQAIMEELPPELHDNVGVISGPSHAEEVAREVPTAIVAASIDERPAKLAQEALMCPTMRVYTSHDVIGVELGGALKNVIALATGIADGLGFGDNTRAALMTRGLAEMARLGIALGANPLTFAGLSGMGDLVVTCMSMHSRNRRAGIEIGRGRKVEEVLGSTRMVVEGVPTTRAAVALARRTGVDMPVAFKLHDVLFSGLDPMQAVTDLMTRDPQAETASMFGTSMRI
ncbi:MAG: NAD(P)H-dependent glycerol-3-phosphate dehydrogenase [Bacteroidota bacterium]